MGSLTLPPVPSSVKVGDGIVETGEARGNTMNASNTYETIGSNQDSGVGSPNSGVKVCQ
ncbi:MAG TPA: hypothetical protein VG122_06175 [Gemmata sp.]|jgi:hypothetical protein|nr:hypothetical protein [Gemmata sp.]